MFNKRLLSICDSSKKWIGLTVLMNWISIVCNIALILFIGTTVDKLLSGNLNLNIISTSIFIIAMLSIRFVANFMSTKFSLYSSGEVKKTLRSTIYEKLLTLGVNYTDTISTSSTVQIAVDGVEQLEMYFGRFMPQLFYSSYNFICCNEFYKFQNSHNTFNMCTLNTYYNYGSYENC